jgi:hypothetical protein
MSTDCPAASAVNPAAVITLALGAGLLALQVAIALLSPGFHYAVDLSKAPILLFTGLLLAAALTSLPLLGLIPRLPRSRWLLLTLVLLGLAMRLSLFDSYPVLEIDFYRYLWDGAVVANGFNPYALPLAQVPGSELSTLAQQAGPVFERINYRELSSIYPPLAQLLFAVAHRVDPWHADGLRYLYLAADCTTLVLLATALKRLGLSPCWSLIYWWNPLLIVLTYNGLHMDILLLPLLMAALLLMMARRPVAAGGALTLAAGIKLWPLLLLPFALRPLLARPRRLALALGVVLVIGGIVLLPMLIFAASGHSGLAAFGQYWQRNSFLFPQLVQLLAVVSDDPQWHARLLLGLALTLLPFYLLRREAADMRQTIGYMTITAAALFLLNPVQLPWYCLWFLPLLCIYRQPALLLLIALMPLYFLRFHFDHRGAAAVFDQGIVALQYLPPLLLWLWQRHPRQARAVQSQHV